MSVYVYAFTHIVSTTACETLQNTDRPKATANWISVTFVHIKESAILLGVKWTSDSNAPFTDRLVDVGNQLDHCTGLDLLCS